MSGDTCLSMKAKIAEAVNFLMNEIGFSPDVCAVAGSGLGDSLIFEDGRTVAVLGYSQVPYMPVPSVEGHGGKLVFQEVESVRFCLLAGRVHLYEGWSSGECCFGVRMLASAGCRCFILTNAAGSLLKEIKPGSLVLIKDHINLTGEDPTRGKEGAEFGSRFTGMTDAYDRDLRKLLFECGREEEIELTEGVYAALKGPSYETPAEIEMLRAMGATLVGMSTTIETIALRQMGARVASVSCVTNLGAGLEGSKPSHEEVKQIASSASIRLRKLIRRFLHRVKEDFKSG